jgi:hypothetical protein
LRKAATGLWIRSQRLARHRDTAQRQGAALIDNRQLVANADRAWLFDSREDAEAYVVQLRHGSEDGGVLRQLLLLSTQPSSTSSLPTTSSRMLGRKRRRSTSEAGSRA